MPSTGNRPSSTGIQYATKSLFDRTVYFPGSNNYFKNASNGSKVLASTYLSRTGTSGGSLKRAVGPLGPTGACNLILSYY
jgi:hypothetical protein